MIRRTLAITLVALIGYHIGANVENRWHEANRLALEAME